LVEEGLKPPWKYPQVTPLRVQQVAHILARHLHGFTRGTVIEKGLRIADHRAVHDIPADVACAPVDGPMGLTGDEVEMSRC
jgi:hypothetical protein